MGAGLDKELAKKKNRKKEKIDLKGRGLTGLPATIGGLHCKELILCENDLTVLPPEIGKLDTVEILDANNNRLNSLPEEIGDLKTLTQLYLAHNKLFFMPLTPKLGQLCNLQLLVLSDNKLDELPRELSQCSALTSLDLSENALKTLPPEFGRLENMTTLNLANNQLRQLPSEVGNMRSLSELLLTHNLLMQVPPEIANMRSLKTLRLGFNKLSEVPPTISQLSTLEDLELRDNPGLVEIPSLEGLNQLNRLSLRNLQLTTIPGLASLVSLTDLDLRDNFKLGCVPDDIANLVNLKKLDLYGCGIKTVPSFIGNLRQLESLDLRKNSLDNEGVPSEIGGLTGLIRLLLSNNAFTQVPPQILALPALREFEISGNKIMELTPEIGRLATLQRFNIGNNKLQRLPDTIGSLTELTNLTIKCNELKELPPEIAKLVYLERLDMSENLVAALPYQMGHMKNLKTLDVTSNPLIIPPGPEVNKGTDAMLFWLRDNEDTVCFFFLFSHSFLWLISFFHLFCVCFCFSFSQPLTAYQGCEDFGSWLGEEVKITCSLKDMTRRRVFSSFFHNFHHHFYPLSSFFVPETSRRTFFPLYDTIQWFCHWQTSGEGHLAPSLKCHFLHCTIFIFFFLRVRLVHFFFPASRFAFLFFFRDLHICFFSSILIVHILEICAEPMSLCSHAEREPEESKSKSSSKEEEKDEVPRGTPRVPRPRTGTGGAAGALLERPATAAQLHLFAQGVERVLSQNKKHLFALQLSQRRGRDTLAHVPNMDAPLVDRSGRLPAALVTPYDGMAPPPYAFEAYLARIARYTGAAPVYYLLAFVYMDRIACTPRSVFRQRISRAMPDAPGLHARGGAGDAALDWWHDRVYLTPLNVHRMFLACFVVAVKYWSDHFYNNRAYGRVGGVRSEEMTSLELATLIWLDFRLGVDEARFVPAPQALPDADYSALLQRPAQLLPALLCPTLIALLRETLANAQSDDVHQVLHSLQNASSPSDTKTDVPLTELISDKMPFSTLVELLSTTVFL